VICADVVGFSRLVADAEEEALGRLAQQRQSVIDPALDKHRGRLFKTMGDGLLAEFQSAIDAVRCALAIQERIAEAESERPDAKRMIWRIAIHLGDVVVDGSDLVGDGVNVASRLQALAPPGGVLVSQTIRDHLPASFTIRAAGTHRLKNIARPIEVFEVMPAGSEAAAARPAGVAATDVSREIAPAVVRAEVRSFGVLMGEDDGATRAALQRGREIVTNALTGGRANTVATPADTVIAGFADAVDGVSRTASARDTLIAANHESPVESRVHYRFGIELGRVEGSPDGPAGEAVERAAAIGMNAQPDGIRLSEAVRAQLPGQTDLKLAAGPDGTYALLRAASPVDASKLPVQLEALDLPLPDKPSIGLLPFVPVGDDPDGAALAEGLRIDIQNALVKMSGLFLLGAGSANAFRGVPGTEVAPRVGVRYVLEGSVRRAGDKVRITAQLSDTLKESVVWSEHYDRTLDDTFALQDEITERIVTALNVNLSSGEQARVWHKCITNPRAREVFYRGIQAFFRMNSESMATARKSFEQVAEMVKDSAVGPANVAMSIWIQSTRGWIDDPQHARMLAGEWAERAIPLEDADGQGHTVLGNVRLLQRRYDEAVEIARKALEIRPGCNNANGFLANVLLHCGETAGAITHAKRAIRLMPVYPPWFVEILAAAYRESGQNDLAAVAGREIVRIAPATLHGRLILTSSLVRAGWVADARRIAREILALDKNFSRARYAAAQPYRDPDVPARLAEDLATAGLPD
jgi:adenylate cyclase